MSLMQQIKHGRQPMPPRLVLYGTEGVGKSTFASEAPSPIFVQTGLMMERAGDKAGLSSASSADQSHAKNVFVTSHNQRTASPPFINNQLTAGMRVLNDRQGVRVSGAAPTMEAV